jgi:hypothetical protein
MLVRVPAHEYEDLVDEVLLRTGRRCVVVKRDHRVLGIVTPRGVRIIERARWHQVTAGEVMRPPPLSIRVTEDAQVGAAPSINDRSRVLEVCRRHSARLTTG